MYRDDFGNVVCLSRRDTYRRYKEKHKDRKIRKGIVSNRDDFRKAVLAITETIADNLIEKPGGVFLKKLGYFFIWMIPRPLEMMSPSRGKTYKKFNNHTGNMMYVPVFAPARNTWISLYSMDKTFSEDFRRKLAERIMSGKRYKMFMDDFKRYLA